MTTPEKEGQIEELCLTDEGQKSASTMRATKKRTLIIWKNVILISIAFSVTFMAFQSLQALQSSLNASDGMGVTALTVTYSMAILTNILFTPLIISKTGCKWSMVSSTFAYTGFALAHLYPTWYTLISGAFLVGIAAGPLWASKCTYLTSSAIEYSKLVGKEQGPIVTHFFGIFSSIVQSGYIFGGVLMSVILKPNGGYRSAVTNGTMNIDRHCGGYDCPSKIEKMTNGTSKNIADPESVILLMSIFSGAIFLSGIFLMIFVDNIKTDEDDAKITIKSKIYATIKLSFTDKRMLFLLPIHIYSTLLPGFVAVDFSKSFITCALGISSLGYVLMCMTVGHVAFSLVIGQIERCIGRKAIMFTNYVLSIGILIFLLLWDTEEYPTFVFYAIACVFGVMRCIWRTETNSTAGVLFPDDLKTAFSVVRTCASLGLLISFGWGYHLCVYVKIYIHIAFLTLAISCYFVTEYLESKRQRKKDIAKKIELTEMVS